LNIILFVNRPAPINTQRGIHRHIMAITHNNAYETPNIHKQTPQIILSNEFT